MGNAIDDILSKRRPAEAVAENAEQGDKFFSVLLGDGLHEDFLEVRFRDGTRTCFPYRSLTWFNLSPEDGIDLDFDGYMISIRGRGLESKLWNGIKQMRVAWVTEASVELQDHKGNECFISDITITPPEGFGGDDAAEE